MRAPTTALFVAMAALVGCAAERPTLTSPASGGPAWSQCVSQRIVLETDLQPAEAAARLAVLEQMHEAVSAVTGIEVPPRAPRVEVVLFSRKVDFLAFVEKAHGVGGYFSTRAPGDLEPQPILVIHEEETPDEIRITFQHELAHRLLALRYPFLERWLNEGLAQYYSTVEAHPTGLILGDGIGLDFWGRTYSAYTWSGQIQQLNIPLGEAPRASAIVSSGDGFYAAASKPGRAATAEDRAQQSKNYAAAWRLVHYLFDEAAPSDRARFATYLAGLQRGERGAFASRFAAELPRLDRDFEAYLARPVRRSIVRRGLAVSAAPTTRRLSEVEVHLLWSRLFSPDDDRAGAEAAIAMRLAPYDAEPHFRRAAVMMHEHLDVAARQEIAAARAIAPHNPRYVYAEVLLDERERRPVPPALIVELARTAVTAAELERAASHAGRRDLGDGLLLAARAVGADPLCSSCQVTRALLLARGGAFDDALAAVDRAETLLPESSAEDLQPVRRRILEIQAQAGR